MNISCNNCGYKFTQIKDHRFTFTKNENGTLISTFSKTYATCPHCQGALVESK